MDYKDLFQVDATLVANEFLDRYMPEANGEYVKVYLYLLKNRVGGIDIGTIAENLHLTEGDVRRALKYWEEQGILTRGKKASCAGKTDGMEAGKAKETGARRKEAGKASVLSSAAETAEDGARRGSAEQRFLDREEVRRLYKRAEGAAALDRLSRDAEFSQLLFVVQKYMSKILTDRDQQVFAYLYDGLKMPCDVLEYLVEYCVQSGHTGMRYIETVGLDWVDSGIRDVEAAKKRTKAFERDREETGRRKTANRQKLGVTRGTDYNSVFSDRSSVILEQVAKRMEQ